MSDNGPSLYERNRYIKEAVTLFANDQIYDGWKSVSVVRSLNSIASSFELTLVDPWTADGVPWRLAPGNTAHLHLDKTSIVTGYIDSVSPSISGNSRQLSARGRSKTGDLVDCSAVAPYEFTGLTIEGIAKKLCAPFGINVLMQGPAGGAISRFNIRVGETVFEVLDRLAREKTLLMYPSYEGNLIFAQKGSVRASSEIRQGANLLSADGQLDNTNRFASYKVVGQATGKKGTAKDAIGAVGTASDSGITRYRPLIVNSENPIDTATAIARAKYEAAIRAAKASTISVSVWGWFQEDGKLWDINQVVAVDIPYLGVRDDFLIEEVTYSKSDQGTTAQLKLIRPDAFEFNPDLDPQYDPSKKLGKKKTGAFSALGI